MIPLIGYAMLKEAGLSDAQIIGVGLVLIGVIGGLLWLLSLVRG